MFERYLQISSGEPLSARSSIGPTYRKLLYEILMEGRFKNVLEIGCLRGYSSVAFLQALDDGAEFHLSLVDPHPHLSLMPLVDKCKRQDRIRLHRARSIDVISEEFDFLFIDGDHTVAGVGAELLRILECQIESMVAHDIWIEHPKHPEYRGAHLYRHVFCNHRDYLYIDDREMRSTDPYKGCGLAFFTREVELYRKIAPLFSGLLRNTLC